MEIGEPRRTIYIEPLTIPVPQRAIPEPAAPKPVTAPEPEKVPVPA